MRLRKLWKAGMLTMALAVASVSTYPVYASSEIEERTDEETDEDSAEDTEYSKLRGVNLNYGNVKIVKLSSNEVALSGLTQCHRTCSTVYLSMYLERKVNGVYSTYKLWDYTKSNATYLGKSMDVRVPSGYYYRLRGYHAAKNGSKESVTTLTQGFLVK